MIVARKAAAPARPPCYHAAVSIFVANPDPWSAAQVPHANIVLALLPAFLSAQLVSARESAGIVASAPVVSPVAAAGPQPATAYRLGTGDRLRITVFNEATLSGEFEVD